MYWNLAIQYSPVIYVAEESYKNLSGMDLRKQINIDVDGDIHGEMLAMAESHTVAGTTVPKGHKLEFH